MRRVKIICPIFRPVARIISSSSYVKVFVSMTSYFLSYFVVVSILSILSKLLNFAVPLLLISFPSVRLILFKALISPRVHFLLRGLEMGLLCGVGGVGGVRLRGSYPTGFCHFAATC